MKRNHFFIAPPGWSLQLGDELTRTFPNRSIAAVSEEWWNVDLSSFPAAPPCVAFALQSLPNAEIMPSTSIRKDADAVALHLRERLKDGDFDFQVQVFAPHDHPSLSPGKAKLLRSAVTDSLKRKAKSLLARIHDAPSSLNSLEGLVQITWLTPQELVVSSVDGPQRRKWNRCLSIWPGGVAPVAVDRRPPSRAYRKLLEALAQMGCSMERGESVVDLAASPGGWSFVALDQGAKLIAVDRSPLDVDLMKHPRLQFIQGDAFKFAPSEPVDWMLADIAAYPERTLELVRRWLESGWCERLIATVKFTGTEGYGILEEFKSMLAESAHDFRIRKLLENKNEATVMAWRTATVRSGDDSPGTANAA